MRTPSDENAHPRLSELERANALMRDETFMALIETAVEAHTNYIRAQAGGGNFEDMAPDFQTELKELQLVKLLLEGQERAEVYKVTSTQSAVYISFAPEHDIQSERLALFGPPKRDIANPVWQLNVRVVAPPTNTLRQSPEDIVVNTPQRRVTVMPEQVYIDKDGAVKFRRGTGTTMHIYSGGRAELYGAKGVGDILYTTQEPIAVVEGDELAAMMQKLP